MNNDQNARPKPGIYLRQRLIMVRFFLCLQIGWFAISNGQDAAIAPENERQASPKPIPLAELPEPPIELKKWIEVGDVKLSFGGRKPLDDRMMAETKYRMVHRYRSNPRWSIRNRGTDRVCLIRLRFRSIRLSTTHEVWFLELPATEDFWGNPLVLHEFDHVRLSADPRLAKRFAELVQEETVIEKRLGENESVDEQWVQDQVDQYVQEQFARVSDIAAIRYRELDRLTRHGRSPIPADSEIAKTMEEISVAGRSPR
jgi:hypothetical protein